MVDTRVGIMKVIRMIDRVPGYGVLTVWMFVTAISTLSSGVSCMVIRYSFSVFVVDEKEFVVLGEPGGIYLPLGNRSSVAVKSW